MRPQFNGIVNLRFVRDIFSLIIERINSELAKMREMASLALQGYISLCRAGSFGILIEKLHVSVLPLLIFQSKRLREYHMFELLAPLFITVFYPHYYRPHFQGFGNTVLHHCGSSSRTKRSLLAVTIDFHVLLERNNHNG